MPWYLLAMVQLWTYVYVCHSKQCLNPAPGIQKMARGVDITTLDILPLDSGNTQNGYRSDIFGFTCNKELKWTDPQKKQYDKPDQIMAITTEPRGISMFQEVTYKSYQEVRRKMSKDAGVGGLIKAFSFSASASFERMQHTITEKNRYIEDVSVFESTSSARLAPYFVLSLHEYTKMFMDYYLTGPYSTHKDKYEEFIKLYGTHYFTSAKFGGYIRVFHETKSEYFYTKTDKQVEAQAKASFAKLINLGGSYKTNTVAIDTRFDQMTTKTTRYYGGEANLLNGGVSHWQTTVDADPWLFAGNLAPIYDLIDNSTIKSSMKAAVNEHILRQYLLELQRLVDTAKSKYGSASLTKLQQAIENEKKKALLDTDLIQKLGREVERELIVPSWFLTETQLCYKWRADGDGGQCGGGAATLLCAKPNTMTSEYRDDTDRRGGGCQMRWGIQPLTQSIPAWFKNVKVCFRYHPDGDAGQCGIHRRGEELCAAVGSYTSEYRDDTDRRKGGCQMSWRLLIPSDAPMWMANSQLCYVWRPDGDGGQCGPAPSRNLCAKANTWTAYYRDDTDRRGGGCRMTWGIKVVN